MLSLIPVYPKRGTYAWCRAGLCNQYLNHSPVPGGPQAQAAPISVCQEAGITSHPNGPPSPTASLTRHWKPPHLHHLSHFQSKSPCSCFWKANPTLEHTPSCHPTSLMTAPQGLALPTSPPHLGPDLGSTSTLTRGHTHSLRSWITAFSKFPRDPWPPPAWRLPHAMSPLLGTPLSLLLPSQPLPRHASDFNLTPVLISQRNLP